MNPIESLIQRIQPTRNELLNHSLYAQIRSIDDFRIFMEQHVFAVWDFMSLLKKLQIELTCVQVPWRPVGDPNIRKFINEIVMGEESDLDAEGKVLSHFEMYLEAMEAIGANTQPIIRFMDKIQNGMSVNEALETAECLDSTKDFVRFTFELIDHKNIHEVAAAFTFGREDLIPNMFVEILREMKNSGQQNVEKLLFYLERHIEVDGGEHGPIALSLIESLCGNDAQKWESATFASQTALEHRIALWNGVQQQLRK